MCISISDANSSGKVKLNEQHLKFVGITGSVFQLPLEVYDQYFSFGRFHPYNANSATTNLHDNILVTT